MSGTNTWSPMSDWVVCDCELSQEMTDHVVLDFDNVEFLSIVDANDGANHFRNDNHVPEMTLNNIWLLSNRALLQLNKHKQKSWMDTHAMMSHKVKTKDNTPILHPIVSGLQNFVNRHPSPRQSLGHWSDKNQSDHRKQQRERKSRK
jgi:hypothetical protein